MFIFGVSMVFCWEKILNCLTRKELELLPGTKSFKNWEHVPIPLSIDIYFFNWTNPENIADQKPAFTQMGPYRLYEKRTKVGMVWHENKTVTFRQTRHWYYDADNSNGTLDDLVTSVNIVPLTAANLRRYHNYWDRFALSMVLMGRKIETRKTVRQLLFTGYNDELLTLAQFFPTNKDGREISTKFGWFYNRNGTDAQDGVFNMATGEGNVNQLGNILKWNNSTTTGFYPGECGRVAGNTGEIFPPGIKSTDFLSIFSPDLCRSIELKYSGDAKLHGLNGLRFSGGPELMDSGMLEPANGCFCNGQCPPQGLLNLTQCRRGAPIFVSYPHFLHADPHLLDDVQGLSPHPEDHSFHMTVEPNLGFTMDLKGRFQLNLKLEPSADIILYKYVPKTLYMPVLWFDQRATLTEELAEEFRIIVLLPSLGRCVLIVVSVLGFLIGVAVFARACSTLTSSSNKTDSASSRSGSKPKVFLEDMQVSSSTKLLG